MTVRIQNFGASTWYTAEVMMDDDIRYDVPTIVHDLLDSSYGPAVTQKFGLYARTPYRSGSFKLVMKNPTVADLMVRTLAYPVPKRLNYPERQDLDMWFVVTGELTMTTDPVTQTVQIITVPFQAIQAPA